MDDNNILLTISIKYNNISREIKKDNLISYNTLKQEAINLFKIDKEDEEFIQFIYRDEDGDNIILSPKQNEIFEAAHEIDDDNYFLELNLVINKYKEKNLINKDKKNLIEIFENNNNKNDFDNNEQLNNKIIKKIKTEFNNKLKQINNL